MDQNYVTPDGSNDKIVCSNKHDSTRKAKKYCQKCQKFLCSDCLVDFDILHLKENCIISVDEYFNKFKDTISDIYKSISSSKQVIIPFQKSVRSLVDNKVEHIISQVDNFTNTLTQELFNFNNSIKTQMSKFKEQYLAELKERSILFKYIDNDYDVMLQELEKSLKNWDVNLRTDKIKIINEVNTLYAQPEREIKQAVDNFNTNRDKLTSITVEKQSALERIFTDIKIEEKLKKIRNIIHNNERNIVDHDPYPVIPNSLPNLINIKPVSEKKEIKLVEIGVVRDLNNTIIKEFIDRTDTIEQAGIDHSFIIGIRNNVNSVYVYWNKKIHEINIGPKQLEIIRSKNLNYANFPFRNCRIANIGNSAILTGGSNDTQTESKECFQITPIIENSNIKLLIDEFPKMNDARERHNMIYLKNFNCILVCSSFQRTRSTEICYLADKKWLTLHDMKTRRANSTLTYVDNRWLFCISGYIVDIDNGSGTYSNSYEVLDMNNITMGWKEHNFTAEFDILKMSAMGCINLNKNEFILIGGFNGSKYIENSYHVTITTENGDGKLATIKKIDNTLDSGVIFQNASFMKSGKCYINFDYTKVCELTALK